MQFLFYTLHSARKVGGVDQWHCRLRGELNVPAFQKAWQMAADRHAILRTAFQKAEGLKEVLQLVYRQVTLPWTVEDLARRVRRRAAPAAGGIP